MDRETLADEAKTSSNNRCAHTSTCRVIQGMFVRVCSDLNIHEAWGYGRNCWGLGSFIKLLALLEGYFFVCYVTRRVIEPSSMNLELPGPVPVPIVNHGPCSSNRTTEGAYLLRNELKSRRERLVQMTHSLTFQTESRRANSQIKRGWSVLKLTIN